VVSSGHQWSSVASSDYHLSALVSIDPVSHLRASVVISSHQQPSTVISSHQQPSAAISSHQQPSAAISSHQRSSPRVSRVHLALRSWLLLKAVTPLLVILFAVVGSTARQCIRKGCNRHSAAAGVLGSLPIALIISFLFVPSVTMSIFQSWLCVEARDLVGSSGI
jgi:hypothetical protein